MKLTRLQKWALSLLVRTINTDREQPVYIILTGDDKAEVQRQGQPKQTYQFNKRDYPELNRTL